MVLSRTPVVCLVLRWSLAVVKRLRLAKGHKRRLIRKWKQGSPALSYIIPMWIFYLCAAIHFKAAQGESFPYWRCGTSSPHKRVFSLIERAFFVWRCPWGGCQVWKKIKQQCSASVSNPLLRDTPTSDSKGNYERRERKKEGENELGVEADEILKHLR